MENKDHPAYPVPCQSNDGSIQHDVYFGLTKREMISAMAMQGILANYDRFSLEIRAPKHIAARAVEYADALLKELEANK